MIILRQKEFALLSDGTGVTYKQAFDAAINNDPSLRRRLRKGQVTERDIMAEGVKVLDRVSKQNNKNDDFMLGRKNIMNNNLDMKSKFQKFKANGGKGTFEQWLGTQGKEGRKILEDLKKLSKDTGGHFVDRSMTYGGADKRVAKVVPKTPWYKTRAGKAGLIGGGVAGLGALGYGAYRATHRDMD